jgi:hypothetical protein
MVTPETKSRWLAAAGVLLTVAVTPLSAQVPEPETVFFGRIVNRTTAQEYLVTQGTLTITVSGEGVAPLEVSAEVKPYADGRFSYVLKMPHQAKSIGLAVEGGKLPLAIFDSSFENVSMSVNGESARPIGTGSTAFVASQPRRGGVHRLDLEVFSQLDDTDRDGIPDWWEDRYGLDKQDRSDALQRWGNNRYTYLEAFRLGLNPNTDDRVPELLTTELTVMEQGATGLLLRTVASGSTPAQIQYRLAEVPAGGVMILRNARPDPKLPHREMKAGAVFTQADVDAGRVEFVHADAAIKRITLQLAITGNNAELPVVEREVILNVFSPQATEGRAGETLVKRAAGAGAPEVAGTFAEIWRKRATQAFADEWTGSKRQIDWIAASLLSRHHDFTVWDGTMELPVRRLVVPSTGMTTSQYQSQFVRLFGRARRHVIFAGGGMARIEGGMSDDVLVAGTGESTLRGGGGADIFVVSEGKTLVKDFKSADGDMLDLSALLQGWPGKLEEKARVQLNAGNTWLRIALDAEREAIVILEGLNLGVSQLENLRRRGRIFSGDLGRGLYAANRAPVAVADEAYVVAGEPVTIPVLVNDYDPDGDSLNITSATDGVFGTVQIIDDFLLYLPGAAFNGADQFTYTVRDGQGGLAEGKVRVSLPFPAAAGRYVTLVYSADGAPIGGLSLQLGRAGTFSVLLRVKGVSYGGKGSFDPMGNAVVTVRAGARTVEVALTLDLSDPSYPLTGAVRGLEDGVTLEPAVVDANTRYLRAEAKRYTLVADSAVGVDAFSGHGFAAVSLSRRHQASIAGRLADGAPFTSSVPQDRAGNVLWSARLYRGKGWMLGRLSLAETSGAALSGSLKWSLSGEGGVHDLASTVSGYLAPSVATVSALDFPDPNARLAQLTWQGGGVAEAQQSDLTFRLADVIRSEDASVKVRLLRSTGVLSGSVRIGDKARPLYGVILQDTDTGKGCFIQGAQGGSFNLLLK